MCFLGVLQEFILFCCAQIPTYEMEIILSNSMILEPDIIIIAKPEEALTAWFCGFNALKINKDYMPLPSENKTSKCNSFTASFSHLGIRTTFKISEE